MSWMGFQELSEGVGTMKPKEEDIVDKTQPEVGLLESEMKEILLEVHEEVGVERGQSCAHGGSFDLEVMLGVKGEVVVSEDELDELDKEFNVW